MKFQNPFILDYRSVALMRISIGLIVLIDVCIRFTDIGVFYTDAGVVPLKLLKAYPDDRFHYSLHALSGSLWWQVILFITAGIAALCFTVGYKTKIFNFISWILLLSVQNRNPFILQGGDDLIRLVLFFGMFLPWDKKYSVDAVQKKYQTSSNTYFDISNIAYLVLISSVFLVSAFLKNSDEWNKDFTATYYALSLDQMLLPLGKLIYPYPALLKVLTAFVYYTELLIPPLLFVPFFVSKLRWVVIVLLALLSIGFGSMLFVGLFFIICLACLPGLIPSDTMNKVDGLFHKIIPALKQSLSESTNINLSFFTNHIRQPLLILLLVYYSVWSVSAIKSIPYTLEDKAKIPGKIIRLDSYWGMFAPTVFKDDGWYVYEGITTQNQRIDLNRDGECASIAKPENIVSTFKNDRWRKYAENYLFIHNNYIRPFLCDYLLNKWNREHPDKIITKLSIVYFKEVTLPDYKYTRPMREVLCECLKQ